jgi:hypothetical protein
MAKIPVNLAPGQIPDGTGGSGLVEGDGNPKAYAGTRDGSSDPTNEPGQYPVSPDWGNAIFGGPLPQGTGAPGTQGAKAAGMDTDPTNEPGQLTEGISGMGPPQTDSTGAPGSPGAQNVAGGATAIQYTRNGSFLTGTYKSDTFNDDITGPRDSTQANDQGYASGGPQLPGLHGNEPEAQSGPFQPGSGGRVLRGGRAVRP